MDDKNANNETLIDLLVRNYVKVMHCFSSTKMNIHATGGKRIRAV